jgi:two-component system copper resistance phosphate regulon response regulator CusR
VVLASQEGVGATLTRVLLIEHDGRVRQRVQDDLRARGFAVNVAPDGASGIEALRRDAVDVVLLDLVLPDVDSYALLAAIRSARARMLVIALTAGDDERSQLGGLDCGADDYVTKPFSPEELAARIRARLCWRDHGATVVEAGSLVLDLANHRALIGNNSVLLSARESSLLAAFMRRAGEVLSRNELLRLVWEIEFDPGSNVVDVYVGALRRKLGAHVIETVRGRGYRFGVG